MTQRTLAGERLVPCAGKCGKSYPTTEPEPEQDDPESVWMFWCFPCRMSFQVWCMERGVDPSRNSQENS